VDEAVVVAAARETQLVVTLEDHFETGGLFSIVAEVLLRHGVRGRVVPLGLRERWFKPGRLADVLTCEGFTGARIAERVLDACVSLPPPRHETQSEAGGVN